MEELNTKVHITPEFVLKNPVMVASGTFGYGLEFTEFMNISQIGAIVVKGLSLKPRAGNPPPRIIETPAGLINAIGLQNIGVEHFVKDKLPELRRLGATVVANIFGERVDEYREVARILDGVEGISAIEVNISCPNVKKGGLKFGQDPASAREVVAAVREATGLPLITKLSPDAPDLKAMIEAVEEAGTDAISLVNTIPAMAIDVEKRRPVLSTVTGGLSGPAIKPIALRLVWQAASVAKVPVIGIGGIMNGRDALEFIIAGARAVQVGTLNLVEPRGAMKVIKEIEAYMRQHRIENIEALTGSLVLPER
ncbi:MAG TPA: dihydroorotate dehydrogenase [Deltaproteobacteria bacterium]|nr:dihydroorotate dehydrogenase [Deltaproteobacteria bacterium]